MTPKKSNSRPSKAIKVTKQATVKPAGKAASKSTATEKTPSRTKHSADGEKRVVIRPLTAAAAFARQQALENEAEVQPVQEQSSEAQLDQQSDAPESSAGTEDPFADSDADDPSAAAAAVSSPPGPTTLHIAVVSNLEFL